MKAPAIARFRQLLTSGEPLYGLTVTAEAAAVTDIAAGLGLDWILLDADQHGSREIAEHVRATRRSNTVVFIRTPALNHVSFERIISLGADGILMRSTLADEQIACISELALFRSSLESLVDTHPLAAYTVQESDDDQSLNRMLTSAEIDIVFLRRHAAAAAEQRLKLIRSAGKYAGLEVEIEHDLILERDRGFQVLNFGSDTGILFGELRSALAAARDCATKRMGDVRRPGSGEKH